MQHPFFIADNDIRRPQIQQVLETVVAIDDPPIQIIEVAGGETSAVQLHHRAQIRRNHRQRRHNHPFGTVALGFVFLIGLIRVSHRRTAILQAFDNPQPFGGLLAPLFRSRRPNFMPKLLVHLRQIQSAQNIVEGLGAHAGLENIAKFAL